MNFRSKDRWSPSFRFPEGKHMQLQRLSARWAQINLPKFGQVRLRFTRELGGQIRSATLTRDGVHGDWYISILIEDGVLAATCDPTLPAVGIDRGVKVALALSDGQMLDRAFTSPAEQARIAALQRKAARQHGPALRAPVAAKAGGHRRSGGWPPKPGSRRNSQPNAAGGTISPPKPPGPWPPVTASSWWKT